MDEGQADTRCEGSGRQILVVKARAPTHPHVLLCARNAGIIVLLVAIMIVLCSHKISDMRIEASTGRQVVNGLIPKVALPAVSRRQVISIDYKSSRLQTKALVLSPNHVRLVLSLFQLGGQQSEI